MKNEYDMKDLGEVQTIIGWQVIRDLKAKTLKIDKSTFIQDLFKSKNMSDYNFVSIPMKAGCFIKMTEYKDYEKTEIKPYQ